MKLIPKFQQGNIILTRDINGNLVYMDLSTGRVTSVSPEQNLGTIQQTTAQSVGSRIKSKLKADLEVGRQIREGEKRRGAKRIKVKGKEVTVEPVTTQLTLSPDRESPNYGFYQNYWKRKSDKEMWDQKENETALALGTFALRFFPSHYIGAIKEGKTPFVEDNNGTGSFVGDLAADIVLPTWIAKGAKYLGNVGRLLRTSSKPTYVRPEIKVSEPWNPTNGEYVRPLTRKVSITTEDPLMDNTYNPTSVEEIFENERWNRFRNPKYVTKLDREVLESHFPEYRKIQELAMDEGNYMIIPENSPLVKMSTRLDDGRLLFTGDEGTFIQSKSKDFQTKANGNTIKVGFKGGTDQRSIEGLKEQHAPETFPIQENGVFFAGPRAYADTYNNGQESPGFWLFFRNPYDMLNGGMKPFPLENNNIRFVRGVMSNPSYRGGQLPLQTYNTINRVWNSEYLDNPEIMNIITGNPEKMTTLQLALRENLLRDIRLGQDRDAYKALMNYIDNSVKSGRIRPLASLYYDGFIGRDHALGYGENVDLKWPFGSNPETYVITKPEQASLLVGNNGAFNSPAYSRKNGGKLNHFKKITSKNTKN